MCVCVCVCVYICSPCYYCVGRRRRNTCFRSRISICGLSLLFKAPPIGFCNHHIFFFCYLFLPSFVCRRGGGSAGGTGCCCRPPGWLLLPASRGKLYTHTSTRRVVCVSGGLKTRDDRESLRSFSSVISLRPFKLPPPFLSFSLPSPDNDVLRRAIKRRNQQHGSA